MAQPAQNDRLIIFGDGTKEQKYAPTQSDPQRNTDVKPPSSVVAPAQSSSTAQVDITRPINTSFSNVNAPSVINVDMAAADLTGAKANNTFNGAYEVTAFPNSPLTNMMMIYFNEVVNDSEGSASNSPLMGNYVGKIGDQYKTQDEIQQQNMASKLLNSSVGTLASGLGDLMSNKTLLREYVRTSNCAWLLYPQLLRFDNNSNWQELNFDPNGMGLIGMALTGQDTMKNLMSIGTREAFSAITRMGGQGDLAGAASKTVQNTYNDMTFINMQRRTFQLQWTLTPKTPDELHNIDFIVKLLRFHQHPDNSNISNTGVYLTYPGTVNIGWYSWDNDSQDYVENQWLPKISTCVIRSVEVDYTANGQFSFFSNSGNAKGAAPTQVNLVVTLTETHPLMKQDIGKGF